MDFLTQNKMIKRNIYKWHRWVSVIIAIPVIMWTVSGILHPIMTSFKPKVKNQWIKPGTIDFSEIKVSLKDALNNNKLDTISNFRIVKVDDKFYYQVKLKDNNRLIYLSTITGEIKGDGDVAYAKQIAAKLLGDSSKVSAAEQLEKFDKEYVYINRILPVYKISFDRSDGIRLYIDTFGDRMTLATDNNRAAFNRFFVAFHSWGFLDDLGKARLFLIITFASLAFLTSVMGIYIWFLIRRKNKNSKTKYRRWHSRLAIFTSITTLMFTFSGAYHTFKKLEPDNRSTYIFETGIAAKDLQPDFSKITATVSKDSVTNVSVAGINEKKYWQITELKKGRQVKSYLDIQQYTFLPDGDAVYASFLANQFSNNSDAEIIKTEVITKFTDEYGFTNKRLPVIKVQYSKNDNERYYIETSSGKFAAKVQDKDMAEGYSFALLHKYHFMDFAGKTTRDVTAALAATANLLVTILGLILFVNFIIKKKKSSNI